MNDTALPAAGALAPATATTTDIAALVARLSLGVMFLAHGLMKFVTFTLPGTYAFFESVGFPGWTAYVVSPAEVLAGVALVAGFRTRLVALLSLPILLGATHLLAGLTSLTFHHSASGVSLNNPFAPIIMLLVLDMVAAVAMKTSGSRAHSGAIR